MKIQWIDGSPKIYSDDSRVLYSPEHLAVISWLKSENKTLEQWLAENPEPPKPEPTKEELVKDAESKLQDHIVDLTKMVIELREKLAVATGVKFNAVPVELATKLAAVETLKTAEG